IDEVRSGSSYISNNDMRVHFGLGKTEKIEYLEARWTSRLVERYLNPRADSILVVIEGSGHPVERTMQKLPTKDGDYPWPLPHRKVRACRLPPSLRLFS